MISNGKPKYLRYTILLGLLLVFILATSSAAYAGQVLSWTKMADMPTARNVVASGVVGGKIYVLGGSTEGTFPPSGPATIVEAYNPTTNTWETKNGLNSVNIAPAFTTYNNCIYVIGGWGIGMPGALTIIQKYDPAGNGGSGSCTLLPNGLNSGRVRAAAAALNGKIYVFGGTTSWMSPKLATVEEIDPDTGVSTVKGTTIPNGGRDLCVAVTYNSKIYLMGGLNDAGNAINECWEYDPAGNGGAGSFTPKANMISARAGATGGMLINNKIYVGGGITGLPPTNWSTDVQCYDPAAGPGGTWSVVGSCPDRRWGPGCEAYDGCIYLIGGADSNNNKLRTVLKGSFTSTLNDQSTTFSSTGEKTLDLGGSTVKITIPSDASVSTGEMVVASTLSSVPTAPSGVTVCGNYYDISTTAKLGSTGYTIKIPYNPALVSDTANLKVYHWNGSAWEDITIPGSVDTIGHTISGLSLTLSPLVSVTSSSGGGSIGGGFGMNTNLLLLLAGLLVLGGLSLVLARRTSVI